MAPKPLPTRLTFANRSRNPRPKSFAASKNPRRECQVTKLSFQTPKPSPSFSIPNPCAEKQAAIVPRKKIATESSLAGGHLWSRHEVFAVPLPQATYSYTPLPHESLVARIAKQFAVEGVTVRDRKLAFATESQP